MDAAKQKALDAIRNNPVMIFSKNGCPYCKETKDLIKSLGVQTNKVKHLELDVDGELDLPEIVDVWVDKNTDDR